MLSQLSIRNVVIVEQLDLEFEPGFTVLTGETGAGKSILIEALSLALGARCDAATVRTGAERAEVTAVFQVAPQSPAMQWLIQQELGAEENCLLRRVVDRGGKSRAFINGTPVTVAQLKALGEMLLDIHGQHAHQSLQKPSTQRDLLDAFGASLSLAREVKGAFERWQELHTRWQRWQSDRAHVQEELSFCSEQLEILKTLNLDVQEWQTLQTDHLRLSHAASLQEGTRWSLATLAESEGAVLTLLEQILQRLSQLGSFDATLNPVLELLQQGEIQLKEALHFLRRYVLQAEEDEGALAQLEQRLQDIHAVARRYRMRPEELPGYQEQLQQRWQQLQQQESGDSLAQAVAQAHTNFLAQAEQLARVRQQGAQALSQAVTQQLTALALGQARFHVALQALQQPTSQGLETVEFQVATHPTQTPMSLARVASGGELSRLSLAIQTVLSAVSQTPTLIFDEVDTGIGGGVAEIVGRLLQRLGNTHQVLCVTHLPQVAACGHHHFQVKKIEQNQGVGSEVRRLRQDERVEEIARMLGGVTLTPTMRQHAAEILTEACGRS